MAGDIFGGLLKGLSGLMPQDDPDVQLMKAKGEVDELNSKRKEVLAQIGELAIKSYGIESFGEAGERLKLVESNLRLAQRQLTEKQAEKDQIEQAQKQQTAKNTCPSCGTLNPDGVKFCQECGGKMGESAKSFCVSCGAELASGTRFCGECGAKQG